MGREIKFRAWDGHKMFNVDVLAISKCAWDCPDHGKRGVSIPYQPHIEVMQYTGLKDKNGKEIFEGDILTDHGEEPPLYVEYSIKHSAFCFVDKFDRNGTYYYTAETISYEQFEIIGNIYETQELLEGGRNE
jgi:uncharacterized phage protein (TIGR01671 family)